MILRVCEMLIIKRTIRELIEGKKQYYLSLYKESQFDYDNNKNKGLKNMKEFFFILLIAMVTAMPVSIGSCQKYSPDG